MRNIKEIPVDLEIAISPASLRPTSEIDALTSELETNGIVVLPKLFSAAQMQLMQQAFEARLQRLRWNNFDGYFKTEPYRHMVEDVLILEQGFVDLAVHPLVKQILTRCLGTTYELTEAKGWRSLPTKRDFHGWHGDSWYAQTTETKLHREIKVAMYLTDVRSGAFNFVRGSHGKHHPRDLKRQEVKQLPLSQLIEVKGEAGTVFMFDSSAIHRQSHPVLEPRQAIFYAYHDPSVPLREEDVSFYRYHPLLLNAAFLGNLTPDDYRVLGFGNKTNFQPAYVRPDQPPFLYHAFCASQNLGIRWRQFRERTVARARRVFKFI